MINDLDATLEALLRSKLPPDPSGTPIHISFATPDDQFPSQNVQPPAIDLFLYDIRENLDLRGNDYTYRRDSEGSTLRTSPPVRVDFSYLVTAWPGHGLSDPSYDEHQLLGAVMRVLLRYRTIPESALQGALQRQDLPLPVSSLQPGRLQSLGEFWHALGGKPKVALHLTVTAAVDAADDKEVPLVLERTVRFGPVPRVPDAAPVD